MAWTDPEAAAGARWRAGWTGLLGGLGLRHSRCLLCQAWQGERLCAACRIDGRAEGAGAGAAAVARCPRCAIDLPPAAAPGAPCADCRREPPPFESAWAAVDYGHPWDALVARFKFRAEVELARPIVQLMVDGLRPALAAGLPRPALLLPVPLTPERLRERGYNQAWELVRRLGPALGVEVRADLLQRWVGGPHQASLHGAERRAQVRGAFALAPGAEVQLRGLPVVLVDDVMTTGATLAELARVLRRAGAGPVGAWVFARTPAH